VSAGSAATILHVALGLLRQHLSSRVRMSAITLSAGDVCNVIPASAVIEGEVRSTDAEEQEEVKRKFLDCVRAAALATGCTVEVTPVDPPYLPVIQHPVLADRFDAALSRLGRTPDDQVGSHTDGLGGGSTDMGNVSQVVPSIHPLIAVLGTTGMPHTAAFAAETAGPAADDALFDGAYGMACAVVDLAVDADAREAVLELQRARPAGATRRPAYPPVPTGL
jgi:metal-dependent amidase/aminoacylase/carboxypeptidase family protein